MNVELLRQFGQRLLALDGGQSHLGLESRAVIPARSSRHRLSRSRAILAAVRQKLNLSTCPNLPSQLSQRVRCSGVASSRRGNQASGTEMLRPSISATVSVSVPTWTSRT